MPPSSAVAWLRRVCLDDYGYTFAIPAVILASAVLSEAVIRRISFTEIDFQTYVGQAALFLNGERDYAKLDPEGGSGPCVYPAVHLYVYSFFHWLTDGGNNIAPAQHVFAGLSAATNLVVALLYRQAGMPPIAVLPLVLSKRIHSIFLLRMFNDPIAILFVYLALLAAVKSRWTLSALLFSLGLGIKMNVLLFLPGIAAAAFVYTGLVGAVSCMSLVVAVQVLVSLPFTMHDAHAYVSRAFDFSRAFLYVWTVNWRFVPEETFLSQHFAKGLLALHLLLLVLFGLFRWTAIFSDGPQWVIRNLSRKRSALRRPSKIALLCCAFTSNVIGILCSRSLHYQFYSWYFHQVPLLLWFSKLPLAVKLVVPVALEWCWNVFPSTPASSGVLLGCHIMLVIGCFTLPSLTTTGDAAATPSAAREEDEDEVDNLLSSDSQRPSRSQAFDADSDAASQSEDEVAIGREDALQRLAEAKAAKEATERAAFRRRIATRRRLLGLLGRGSLLLRPLLVVLGLALMFVVPHPRSPVSKGTYVDENALQPGQARVYWDYFDVTYADMLSEKVARLGGLGSAERADFVLSELQSYGLDAHRQHYQHGTTSHGQESARNGVNVYARSATPRIDGREAIILTASWRSRWQGHDDPFAPADNATGLDPQGRINVRGVASILALARYLSTQAHLSKDLIFVISDGHLEGIHAWSSAYFGSVSDSLQVDPVATGGSQVWNAISIDYPSDSFSALEVQYEGFDGQLPNMDVINTVVRIAESVAGGMPVDFGAKAARSWLKDPVQKWARGWGVRLRADVEYELGSYEAGVRAALRQVGYGVSGQASGPHGFFQRHHVDAITLYAVPATGPYGFFHMGRLIESFVRSMSNLLERLHHSQFFYLLLNPRRFVPIGTAILIPLFLSISLTISGLALWFAEEKVSKQQREAVLSSLGPAANGELADVQPETPTLGWYRDQVVNKYFATSESEEKVGEKMTEYADALRDSMRPIALALACAGSTVIAGVVALYNCEMLFAESTAKNTKRVSLCSFVGASRQEIQRARLTFFPFSCAMHLQARNVALYRTVFMVLPLAAASILRTRCTLPRARRVGSLLLAFAYLEAGMLVAVLSVLNFALATLLALLAYAALRIASGRPSPTPHQPDAFSWLSSVRAPAVTLFHPVLWMCVLGSSVQAHIEALLTHWKLFHSATVPIVCIAYVPIVLQAVVGVILRA